MNCVIGFRFDFGFLLIHGIIKNAVNSIGEQETVTEKIIQKKRFN